MLLDALNQTATYWAKASKDGFGKLTFSAPVAINVRWQGKQELFVNSQGKEELSQSVIYLGQDVGNDDYLYLGTSVITNPALVTGAYPVKAFSKTVDISGLVAVRKAWL